MQTIYGFIIPMIITLSMTTYAQYHNAVESNRMRLKNLYRNHILIRPLIKNISQTTVALGLGIIEVAGIDPQKQVCLFEIFFLILISFFFNKEIT